MNELLTSPRDFVTGAPDRMMGTEGEDYAKLRSYSSGAIGRIAKIKENNEAIFSILSVENFKKSGIPVYLDEKDKNSRWLVNGQRIYPDNSNLEYRDGSSDEGVKSFLLESCTAEQLGPRKALAGTRAAIEVVDVLARSSELDVEIFRRTATIGSDGEVEKAGFHMNHITSEEVKIRFAEIGLNVLNVHAATRLYTWEGMVAPQGFTLSQKAHGYVDENLRFYEFKRKAGLGFARIEDYSGDDSSPWGTFMAMATTSVLLRVIEHSEEKDLNKQLRSLELASPHEAIRTVSADNTLRETIPLADGRRLTAIEIQTKLAGIASEFSKRYALSEDEQFAIDQWQRVCEDLKEAAKTGNIIPLIDRIGWVGKKLSLERKIEGKLDASNPDAVLFDARWDGYYPKKGGRLILPQKTGITIASDAQVKRLFWHPPHDTRASVRSHILQNEDPIFINWGNVTVKDLTRKEQNRTISLHPYQVTIE